MKNSAKRIISIGIAMLLMLVIIEGGLRLSGRLQTYSEQNFGSYQSPYENQMTSHIYNWNANEKYHIEQEEFTFDYYTNSIGFLDNRLIDTIDQVLFLGDSFVFGVGASQEDNAPSFLQKALQINIINAGIPGSDPFFQEVVIDSLYPPREHNRYLVMTNVTDLYDYIFRGGVERFGENGTVNYCNPPSIEPVYKRSFLFRAIIHGILKRDYTLLSDEKLAETKKQAIQDYTNLFLRLNSKLIQHGSDLIVVIQPHPKQFSDNSAPLNEVVNFSYMNKLDSLLKANNIKTINLEPALKDQLNPENYLDYSWEIDGHYNTKGYHLIANIIKEQLSKRYRTFLGNNTVE